MAVAPKPKGPVSDSIMTPADMKPILALSKQDPVSAAIGITADGDGVILLHKKARPRKVLGMLRTEAKKANIVLSTSSLRFGRAKVDSQYDPGMVRFFINKDAPGNMRVKLLEVVKRVPYQKVEINVDPSLDAEPEDDEVAPDGQAAAPEQSGSPAPPPDAPSAPPIDMSGLRAELGLLIQQIGKSSADVAGVAAMKRLAVAGTEAVKAADAEAAREAIGGLRAALTQQPVTGANGRTPPPQGQGLVAYAKARLAWLAVRKKLETDLALLCGAVQAHYKDRPTGSAIDQDFRARVKPVLEALDESLADMLDEAGNATDLPKRAELAERSRDIIRRYQDFVASDKFFAHIDGNPFVPLATVKTVTDTLSTLSTAIR